MNPEPEPDFPISFGVRADTGRPLNPLTDELMKSILTEWGVKGSKPTPESEALADRIRPAGIAFGTQGGINPNDLEQAGWGIVYSPGVSQAVKDALQPLLDHRKAQTQPFKIFDGPEGFLKGDSANDWLNRRKVRMDVVDPDKGVPFYLLLVGPPDEMPFEFQYSLDIYWAVGRLWFDTAEEFRRYAESVVQYENPATPVPTGRRSVLFATRHDFDAATQLFTQQVALPLSKDAQGEPAAVWRRAKFALQQCLGEKATKAALADILRGRDKGTPALLFSGSHGMQFDLGDPRQLEAQGALVCQDWTGFGEIKEKDWFAASDVPADAKLHGMMHFFFACHSGGCSALDNYDRLNAQPRTIAPRPFFSRLPQKILSHPNGGALAVLAHIERAWPSSFQGQRGGSQIQGFQDVIGRLLNGERIGQAVDMFNIRWAAISTEIAELQADLAKGADVSVRTLANLWVSRDDARNFVILGDPAVRLRVEDMKKV